MTENKKKGQDNQTHGTGEIWVNKFTEDSASQFREQIMSIAMKDDTAPIVINIDSYGGAVDSLAKMIDTLDQINNPIITVCLGKAMSCGAILLSHGHVRYCGPNSRVMVHEVSAGTGGDVHDMYNDAVEAKRLNKHFLGLLAKNCDIKGGYEGLRKAIKQRDGREVWMSPHEALKFGIVDEVGTPQIIPRVGYELHSIRNASRDLRVKITAQILGLKLKKASK